MTARTDAARFTERRTVELCGELLTPMEAQFVRALPLHKLSARAAARAVGYVDDKSGRKLMRRPAVRRAVARQSGELLSRHNITAQSIADELAIIAFSDLRDFMEWGPDGVGRLKPSVDLPPAVTRAVESIKIVRRVVTRTWYDEVAGRDVVEETVTETCELKLYDKLAALKLLIQHLHVMDSLNAERDGPTLVQLAIAIFGTGKPVGGPVALAKQGSADGDDLDD